MTIGCRNYIIIFRVGPNLVANVVVSSYGECRTWAHRPLPLTGPGAVLDYCREYLPYLWGVKAMPLAGIEITSGWELVMHSSTSVLRYTVSDLKQ